MRLGLTLAAAVLALIVSAPAAQAATHGWSDPFDTLDPARWVVGAHALGRSRLDPANVAVSGGAMRLRLPAGTLDGAEVRSVDGFRSGSEVASIQVADAPSSLTGFFLYAAPDYASEIDVEILNDTTGTVMLSTYAGGRQTHTETQALGFDPTAAAHEYRIDHSASRVSFFVDGRLLRTWTTGVPSAPMNLYVNAWFPQWLDGRPAPVGRETVVDTVQHA